MLLSKSRANYERPCVQSGANANPLPRWTPARITGLGEFRALARLATMPCVITAKPEAFEKPAQPETATANSTAAESGGSGDTKGEEADDGLSGFLEAIAAEVQGQAASAQAGISADFAARITQARKSLPRDQAAGVVEALKQAMQAALKFVRESAALETRGRQKAARVLWRRRHLRTINGGRKPWDYGPKM